MSPADLAGEPRRASAVRVRRLALGSIAVGVVVLAIKFLAYKVTGSVALYSDAIESTANVATALAALMAVTISAKPADANHPYGHAKVEYFAAVLEGVVIIVAAVAILREAWLALQTPVEPQAPYLGLAINICASVLNGVWSWVLLREGRRLRSPALVADGRHLLTDLWTSGGVVVGVLLIALTGWRHLDPIVAALVAVNIVWSGWKLVKESVDGLMDMALPDDEAEALRRAIAGAMDGALEAHDVRTRQAGPTTFVDLHLVVDGAMSVSDAHAICDRIEAAVRTGRPDCVISIHVEPPEKQKIGGGVSLLAQDGA